MASTEIDVNIGLHGITGEKLEYLKKMRICQIDRPDAPDIYQEFVDYLDKSRGISDHYYRYCQTFMAMTPFLGVLRGAAVIETGDYCPITRFLMTKGAICRRSAGDLRYGIDADECTMDLVLSLEVIEHLKDQAEQEFEEVVLFQESGVRRYAAEITRVLKPGGVLVLTTPNPCSARTLSLLVEGKPPAIFRPHIREYCRDELVDIFSSLELVLEDTHFSFFLLAEADQSRWASIFDKNGWQSAGRGDDHFLVFRKRNVVSEGILR